MDHALEKLARLDALSPPALELFERHSGHKDLANYAHHRRTALLARRAGLTRLAARHELSAEMVFFALSATCTAGLSCELDAITARTWPERAMDADRMVSSITAI